MAYCTQADIESLLSEPGVQNLTDDGLLGGDRDSAYVTDAIERATSRVQQYAAREYNENQLDGNTWVKWATAVIAAVFLFRRQGGEPPPGLLQDFEETIAHLEGVRAGRDEIPGATPRAAAGFAMSNYRVDHRSYNKKIRARDSISVHDNDNARDTDWLDGQGGY